jgi:hypothetical protein
MPLPLSVRKGIRDYEAKAKEALEQIKTATGKEFTVDYNWEENAGKLDASYNKDNLGYLYQKEVLANVAYCIEENMKEDLIKEAFINATNNNRIVFRVNANAKGWFVYVVENGDFIIEHKPVISNTGDLTYVKLVTVLPTSGLPLTVRKNITEKKPTGDGYLESIAKTTGTGEWIFEADFDAIVPKLKPQTADRIGTIYFGEALYNIDYLLKSKLANELIKEAFNEATNQHKIIFAVNEKIDKYWTISFKDGTLLVQHQPDIYNVGDLSYYDLESVIPVPGVISLPSKINLDATKKEREAALEKIKTASGDDWTFDDSSLEAFYEKLDAKEKLRVGNIVNKEVVPNLASNLEKALKDDMVKEAFQEVATAKTIKVVADPKQSAWWTIKFENGVIVLSAKTPICNTGDISSINIEKLL